MITIAKQWEAAVPPEGISRASLLAQNLQIPRPLGMALIQRGMDTPEKVNAFLHPNVGACYNPFLLKGMDPAVRRLHEAIQRKERILLFGDYDVDGVTAVALLYEYLREVGADVEFLHPDRQREGYGLSLSAITFAQENSIRLVITLDCGIRSHHAVDTARQAGIDVVICDHHLPEATLPAATAIINPKQEGCTYPYLELSGCGLAYKLAIAYHRYIGAGQEVLEKLLDLVGLSIAADIVPVTDENRILLQAGLRRINQAPRPGIEALIQVSRRQLPFETSDLVFGLAPLLNAAGRIADAGTATQLLLTRDAHRAAELAQLLHYRNTIRREYDYRTTEEAQALWGEDKSAASRQTIVLFQPHWHPGILGIVASRIAKAYQRPTIILTRSGEVLQGSARSIAGIDIHAALESCSDILLQFGGHSFAAGLKLRPEWLRAFQDRWEAAIYQQHPRGNPPLRHRYTDMLSFSQITPALVKYLRQFAPFGPGNQRPLWVSTQVRVIQATAAGDHLRLLLAQTDSGLLPAIGFGLAARRPLPDVGSYIDICFTLQQDHLREMETMQLVLKDWRACKE